MLPLLSSAHAIFCIKNSCAQAVPNATVADAWDAFDALEACSMKSCLSWSYYVKHCKVLQSAKHISPRPTAPSCTSEGTVSDGVKT